MVAFVLSRESSDVPRASVFTVFCWVRTKLAPNVHERRQTSKIEPFCPPKSSPGASAGPKIEPKRPRSSEETRPKCPRGRRKFFCRRERGNCERESASSAPEVRVGLVRPRAVISESLNGLLKKPHSPPPPTPRAPRPHPQVPTPPIGFSLFLANFRGAMQKRMQKSNST